tara:strand:+ start:2468 stop:2800 length:333 start_codon:yes stop_codon:yes gene_type:complete
MSDQVIVTLVIVFDVFVVLAVIWLYRTALNRSRKLMADWVIKNGCTLLNAELRVWRKGPYKWASSGQVIFRITVMDWDGRERQGWVCCGSKWKGAAFSDRVEGFLDKEAE